LLGYGYRLRSNQTNARINWPELRVWFTFVVRLEAVDDPEA
jgi:hypothetical protein